MEDLSPSTLGLGRFAVVDGEWSGPDIPYPICDLQPRKRLRRMGLAKYGIIPIFEFATNE